MKPNTNFFIVSLEIFLFYVIWNYFFVTYLHFNKMSFAWSIAIVLITKLIQMTFFSKDEGE